MPTAPSRGADRSHARYPARPRRGSRLPAASAPEWSARPASSGNWPRAAAAVRSAYRHGPPPPPSPPRRSRWPPACVATPVQVVDGVLEHGGIAPVELRRHEYHRIGGADALAPLPGMRLGVRPERGDRGFIHGQQPLAEVDDLAGEAGAGGTESRHPAVMSGHSRPARVLPMTSSTVLAAPGMRLDSCTMHALLAPPDSRVKHVQYT